MDEENKVTPEATDKPTAPETADKPITAEEFNAKMAEVIAENKRLKSAVDKATADASNWKKKFTATQSEAEQLSMEKAEREAAIQTELEELRKESAINRYSKSFMAIGYTEEQAEKAAEAQFAGDTDELLRIQKAHQEEYAKKIKEDLMKTMPAPSIGNDDSVQMTKEQLLKLSYRDQLQFKADHPTVYQKLMQ